MSISSGTTICQGVKRDLISTDAEEQTVTTVVHIIPGLPIGGAERMLLKLVRKTDRVRFSHVVVSLQDQGELGESIETFGVRVYCLGMSKGALNLGRLWKLRRLIHTLDADLIHGWMYYANIASLTSGFAGRSSVPMIWSIRQSLYDLGAEKCLTAWMIRLCAWVSATPNAIIYNSYIGAKQHEAIGYSSHNRHVFPNGFDCDEFASGPDARPWLRRELGFGENAILIGVVARYHPMKDHLNFLDAASRLAKHHSNVGFVLVGDHIDERNNDLMAMVASFRLGQRVRLLGQRVDIARIMSGLDILASASWTEGFPSVIGEAMACEVPCVVTDVGESSHIVGETGVVVPPRDPEALAQGLEQLINVGDDGRRSLGRVARERIVKYFSLVCVVNEYERLYERIVSDAA